MHGFCYHYCYYVYVLVRIKSHHQELVEWNAHFSKMPATYSRKYRSR